MKHQPDKPCERSYLHQISHKRIDPPPLAKSAGVPQLIDEAFLSYNAGRLREACRLYRHQDARRRCDRRPVAVAGP